MNRSTRSLILWSPRLLGILVALFLGLFALDSLGEGIGFVIHLAPTLLLLAAVAISWRWEWVGGVVFLSLAALYAATTLRHPDWILAIAGPMVVVGALYLLSWQHHRELRPTP